jgi:hypothetical protein
MCQPRRPTIMGIRLSPCVAIVVAGLIVGGALGGCSGARTSAANTRSSSPAVVAPSSLDPSASGQSAPASSAPEPTGAGQSPVPGSPTGQPGPSSPAGANEITVTGGVEDGVEPGCRLLRTTDRTYLLLGGDRSKLTQGSTITVRGTVETGIMSTCQQGTPLRVLDVHGG